MFVRESEVERIMQDMKMEQPSWKTLGKSCGKIVLCGSIFTLVVCGVDAVFQFVIRWILGVI